MTPDSQLTQLQEQLKAVTLQVEDYGQSIAILKSELDKVDLRSAGFKAELEAVTRQRDDAESALNKALRAIEYTLTEIRAWQGEEEFQEGSPIKELCDILKAELPEEQAKAALAGGEEGKSNG